MKTKFLMQFYKMINKDYHDLGDDEEILVVAKNLQNGSEITKTYTYKQLYSYYQTIPEYEGVESDVDNVVKTISKRILIGDFSKTGDLQIRMKRVQSVRRDSTPIGITTPMNVVREEEKSSQDMKFWSPNKSKKSDPLTNSSNVPNENGKNFYSHQRHSSKTTKKLGMSLASNGRSIDGGTLLISKNLVSVKSSAVVFSKQEQRKKRKEMKRKQMMVTIANQAKDIEQNHKAKQSLKNKKIVEPIFEEIPEVKEDPPLATENNYKTKEHPDEESEKDYGLNRKLENSVMTLSKHQFMQRFVIEDYPIKALNSPYSQSRDDNREERKSNYKMPPSGRNALKRKKYRNRKLSSSSMEPSRYNSMVSSKFDDNGNQFMIKVIEPIDLSARDHMPVKSNTMSIYDEQRQVSKEQSIYRNKDGSSSSGSFDCSPLIQLKTKLPWEKRQKANQAKELFDKKSKAAILVQKLVRGYIARKDFQFKKKHRQNLKKVYHRILCREGSYHLVQGYLNKNQDIKIIVADVFKKTFTQELTVLKREYVLINMDEAMGMNPTKPPILDSNRSNSAFNNYNIDQVDFNYLIDKHLDYDDIVQ